MRILLAILISALAVGCASFAENNKRVEQLNQQMTAEWLKTHIFVGKTTPEQVHAWFGYPLIKTASSGSSLGAALMPDEIWTYSVRFSETHDTWSGGYIDHWTKSIAFSFKSGTVSDYQITQVAF